MRELECGDQEAGHQGPAHTLQGPAEQEPTQAKIADMLTQLLQSLNPGEITITSIITLLGRDTKGAIIGIFSQVHTHTGDEEAQLVAEIKKVFASATVTAEECLSSLM